MVTEKTQSSQHPLRPIEGEVFAVYKPMGWSSFHLVKKLRSALTRRLKSVGIKKLKVGHAGTLDPLAEGVMLICTGRATKEIDRLQSGVKEYIATIRLGATTPSFDLETPEDKQYPTGHITEESVRETLRQFIGTIMQVPPTYSAVKVDGRRAYKSARAGQEVELKPKQLVIDELELQRYSQQEIVVRVVCSKGTYIRALARDIGFALGSGGYLTQLLRTQVGDYRIESVWNVKELVDKIYNGAMAVTDEQGAQTEVAPLDIEATDADNDKADILPHYLR